jgi:hypothetical protein
MSHAVGVKRQRLGYALDRIVRCSPCNDQAFYSPCVTSGCRPCTLQCGLDQHLCRRSVLNTCDILGHCLESCSLSTRQFFDNLRMLDCSCPLKIIQKPGPFFLTRISWPQISQRRTVLHSRQDCFPRSSYFRIPESCIQSLSLRKQNPQSCHW